ncbi:MAG: AAA family ATPase [Thermoleophilaceae bacterium]|nr:AAA family ATPase [Thermoleophilaceae bacterium]
MTHAAPAARFAEPDTPLLERERELSAFERLVGARERDGSGVVVVQGPPGIGKSRLLAALRDRAASSGPRTLAASGSDLEREFPFGVVRQLFDPALASPGEREALLSDAAAPARTVFAATADSAHGDDDPSFSALHGLYWLVVNLSAESSLLLVVDDLHWCDRASLRFLAYLARRLEGVPVLIMVALRDADPVADPLLVAEVTEAPGAVRLTPKPLTETAVAELVGRALGGGPDAEFTRACAQATAGNPLLLRELLLSLADRGTAPHAANAGVVREIGPRAVSRTVLLRLRRLGEAAVAVARAVAVLGDQAALASVAALAELPEETAADATAALAGAEILRPGARLGFVHALVRDAVYHDLPLAERELQHDRAARLLLARGAPAEEVATHLLMAARRGEPWVVDTLREAAASARRRAAAESAVAYLRRALEEPPPADRRPALLRELGVAETLTFAPTAAEHLRQACDALSDPRERAQIAATLARVLVFTATAEEAVAVARRALAETPTELADERAALRALELVGAFFGVGPQEALTRLAEIWIEGDGPGARMLAATAAFGRALTGAPAGPCVELARQALAGGTLARADPAIFPILAIWVLVMADRNEALDALEVLRALAHRRGSLLALQAVDLWSGAALMWRGDLREAEAPLAAAHEHLAAWGIPRSSESYGPLAAITGVVRLQRGDIAGARELLEPKGSQPVPTDSYRTLLTGWAQVLLAESRHDEALTVTDDLAARFGPITNPAWAPWRSLKARALAGLGRTEEAKVLAREELQLAQAFGSPSLVGRSLRLLGALERDTDRLRDAVAILERSTAKLELAHALLEVGAALRRERRPTDAREPLRRALDVADRCGADELARQARTELYAAGGRPRRAALTGAESLTASERRIAKLAASGRSNKQIAQELYVTLKTVEVHLSNSYRKLGIRSRHELARALGA